METFESIRKRLRRLKRVYGGELVHRVGIDIAEGLGSVSLLLKREKDSGEEYVVLTTQVSEVVSANLFDLGEFDRFIEAAGEIRASQSSAIGTLPRPAPVGGPLDHLLHSGEVLRRIDVETDNEHQKISLRLERKQDSSHEYVVLATSLQDYPIELAEFHQLAAGAKKIRAYATA